MRQLEILSELVSIPSVSGNEQGIADYIESQCEHLGYAALRLENNVVVHIRGSDSNRALLLNAHIDTVPPADDWLGGNPYELQPVPNSNDLLVGLGASDDKAGAAAMLYNLEQSSGRPKQDMWYIFSAKEEIENSGAGLVAQEIERYGYEVANGIIMEPTDAAYVGEAIRGDTWWYFTTEGVGGHTSQTFDEPSIMEGVIRELLSGLPAINESWEQQFSDDLLGSPTISLTGFHFGNSAKPPNVLPNQANGEFSLRVTPSLAKVLPQWREYIARTYALVISQSWEPNPAKCPHDAHIYQVVKQALPSIPFQVFKGANDQPFFHKYGQWMLAFGPGDPEEMHKQNESIWIPAMKRFPGMLQKIIDAY